jgi:hypothetical protein
MKKSGILVSLLLGTMAITGCGKDSSSAPATSAVTTTPPVITKIETDVPANHTLKPVSLRGAESFALLAHASIYSAPTSTITGKVGLRPGTRSMLGLTEAEITGGLAETYAMDDKDTAATTFVTTAKIDMINAFNDMESSKADAEKINLYAGNLAHKVLPAGNYFWNSRVTIPEDLTLVGNETDVFIFKVGGDLRVGTDVTIHLEGGAKASNVFWQVGDNVLIKARAKMVGTVITQQLFEMKEQASLEGRAFSKNDRIVLDKNTITKPQ